MKMTHWCVCSGSTNGSSAWLSLVCSDTLLFVLKVLVGNRSSLCAAGLLAHALCGEVACVVRLTSATEIRADLGGVGRWRTPRWLSNRGGQHG